MNEALVDACLKVARLTRELAEARAEMEAARGTESAVRATKMEAAAGVLVTPRPPDTRHFEETEGGLAPHGRAV